MAALPLEPVSLAVGISAAASAAVLYGLRRLRRGMRGMRDELRAAQAQILVSEALLSSDADGLSAALPAVGLLAGSVTAICPVTSASQRSRLLVASPPDNRDPSIRAAAALLAAVSIAPVDVPELARALRSGLPQRGLDLGTLLKRGITSLPFSTRDKLFERLARTPFVVVPVVRADTGTVVGLLVALSGAVDLDRLAAELGRVATRLALLIPATRKGPARAEGARRRKDRAPTPRDAEVILWLDAAGAIAACEPLQDEWTLETPAHLAAIFGAEESAPLLERATGETPTVLGLARVDEDTLAEVSLVRLADIAANTWGYAAFLRRVGAASERRDAIETEVAARSVS